jgi:hypothetical protein
VGQGFTSCIFRISSSKKSSRSRTRSRTQTKKNTTTSSSSDDKIIRITYKAKLNSDFSNKRLNKIKNIKNLDKFTTGIPTIINNIKITDELKREFTKCTQPPFKIRELYRTPEKFAATLTSNAGNYTLIEFANIADETTYIKFDEFIQLYNIGIKSFQQSHIIHGDINGNNIMIDNTLAHNRLKIIDWYSWWNLKYKDGIIQRFTQDNYMIWKSSPQLRAFNILAKLEKSAAKMSTSTKKTYIRRHIMQFFTNYIRAAFDQSTPENIYFAHVIRECKITATILTREFMTIYEKYGGILANIFRYYLK